MKTKASPDLINKFVNDPVRQQNKKSDLHVVISRHPHDVAGMTSKGHSWVNQSCMNFSSGSMKKHLKSDVAHGTHVAYLAHKSDTELKKPLARIALKPYHHEDDHKDVILRPEHRTYGDAPDAFHHTVNKILNRHMPGDPKGIYFKHHNVYDDSGSRALVGEHALDKALVHDDNTVKAAAMAHPKLTAQHITNIFDQYEHTRPSRVARVLQHPAVTHEHLMRGVSHEDDEIADNALRNPKITSDHIEKAMAHHNIWVLNAAVEHPAATSDQITRGLAHPHENVRMHAAINPNLGKEHFQQVYTHHDTTIRTNLAGHPNFPKHMMEDITSNPSSHPRSVRQAIAGHDHVSDGALHNLMHDPDGLVRFDALHNNNLKKEHLDRALAAGHIDKSSHAFHMGYIERRSGYHKKVRDAIYGQ